MARGDRESLRAFFCGCRRDRNAHQGRIYSCPSKCPIKNNSQRLKF